MKAEFVNPIYKATSDVLRTMLNLDVERGDLRVVEDDAVIGNDANVIIGLTGSLNGSIHYSFSEEMTLEMVRIMSGMEMDEIDKFVSSAVGEIANIISGNATTYLAEQDYDCDIVSPQILIGQSKSFSMAEEKALVIPLKTEIGEFEINLSVKESE